MKPLRLKNPKTPSLTAIEGLAFRVEVAVATPVPHLDGEYSYLAGAPVQIGSLVKIPFGNSQTLGFVTSITPRSMSTEELNLKPVNKTIGDQSWFDLISLQKYRKLAERYGVGLFTILNLAIPIKTNVKITQKKYGKSPEVDLKHLKFLESRYGEGWPPLREKILLIPASALWQERIVSLLLSRKCSTLLLLPTERYVKSLKSLMLKLALPDPAILTSETKSGDRADIYQKILKNEIDFVIGTRSAALAPFNPQRVIILDQGDSNYRERRTPFHRVDESDLWNDSDEIIYVSHAPTLEMLAHQIPIFSDHSDGNQMNGKILSCTPENILNEIKRNIIKGSNPAILISLNDKNFSSSLICAKCRNRIRCGCGFPLATKSLKGVPFCQKCLFKDEAFQCYYCAHKEYLTISPGAHKWALTISKNIKNSAVILSNSTNVKESVIHNHSQPLIVIATHGMEPLLYSSDDKYLGFDFVVLLGGNYGFNSSSLFSVEELRMKWSRNLALIKKNSSAKYKALVELDSDHIEFKRLIGRDFSQLFSETLNERRELSLPPFATLCQAQGEISALIKLREALLKDQLFSKSTSFVYPVRLLQEKSSVQEGELLLKVAISDRDDLSALFNTLNRLRSLKKLSPLKFRLNPENL